ncbi:MAG: potassium transporter Kup [Deltaproteobacteria bacterium]|jgi:KUP system potassium uptake protein|nr:potassium transporter Kup [Deltaproteobacteria bacterium]
MLGALGVVFGDIGTSPLYALRECFTHNHQIAINHNNVMGILSLILWSLLIGISFKYMTIVLRADNKGEGGILSLMSLASSVVEKGSKRNIVILTLGLFGASLLYGDGIITPAISVLSAVEGLQVVFPESQNWVVPITCAILAVLFVFQSLGTTRIGFFFGPLILIWFLVIGIMGAVQIMAHPEILMAINPAYAFNFFKDNPTFGYLVLGSVVLVITGGEALYADMGHFGSRPIRLCWFYIALPALVLNYFGQGSLLLNSPESISNPFYLLAPGWAQVPLIILSTLATTIASQALISGVFSITRQAVQLGFCPRINVIHTSVREIGQIYVPFVNWALFLGVIWLVLNFKSSSHLAAAYGIAVSGTMLITTILAFYVAIKKWKWPILPSSILFLIILLFDVSFFFPNLLKITHGGWVPLVLGGTVYILMTTWQKGRRILAEALKTKSIPVTELIKKIEIEKPYRVQGTAIYMSSDPWGVPIPLLHNLRHNKVLHERVIFLTISTKEIPFVNKSERVQLECFGQNVYRIVASFGFMETPKIKHILEACRLKDFNILLNETTFVLGRETILPSSMLGMALWREWLFAVMAKNAARPTAFFRIPPNSVIEVGIQIEI